MTASGQPEHVLSLMVEVRGLTSGVPRLLRNYYVMLAACSYSSGISGSLPRPTLLDRCQWSLFSFSHPSLIKFIIFSGSIRLVMWGLWSMDYLSYLSRFTRERST